MPSHICPRCNYSTSFSTSFKSHLLRKKICKPLIAEISIEDLRKKYEIDSTTSLCNGCNKAYATQKTLVQHKKKCTKMPEEFMKNITDIKTELNNILDQARILSQQLIEKTQQTTITNINSNITNVVIFDFGKEDLSHILENQDFLKQCLINCQIPGLRPEIHHESGISMLIKEIHGKSENKTIRIKNAKKGQLEKYSQGKWHIDKKDAIYEYMIKRGFNIMDRFKKDNHAMLESDELFQGISDDIEEYLVSVHEKDDETRTELENDIDDMLTTSCVI